MSRTRFTITMLIPRLEPSATGVLVGGHVSALKTLCLSLMSEQSTVPTVITSASGAASRILRQRPPPWGRLIVFRNDRAPQTVGFAIRFTLQLLLYAIRGRMKGSDIIHGHSGYAVYAIATYMAAKLSHAKSVHTVYCPVTTTSYLRGRRRLYLSSRIARVALSRLDCVLAMSENVARSLIASGVPARNIVIAPPAIDAELFHPPGLESDVREKLHVASDAAVLLYVGNLLPSKGLDVLARAFVDVARDRQDIVLVVTTELPDPETERRLNNITKILSSAGVEERVRWQSIVDDMPALMRASDVLVMPYRDTQGPSDYPIALLEAMACSRAVIGTRVGGLSELIGDDDRGWLVPPDDVDGLASAIRMAVAMPAECRRRGVLARDFVVANFSLSRVRRIHNELYEELVDGAR